MKETSPRKYVLKKDPKPVPMKTHTKLPVISPVSSPYSTVKFKLCKDLILKQKRNSIKDQKLVKSLNTYKKPEKSTKPRQKSITNKNLFDQSYFNDLAPKDRSYNITNYNTRYLKTSLESLEDLNIIETPLETMKRSLRADSIDSLIASEYENYIQFDCSPKPLTPHPNSYLKSLTPDFKRCCFKPGCLF